MARSLSYYRQNDSECNIAVSDRALVVNCAGRVVFRTPFTSDRPQGRKDYYLLYCTRGSMRIHLNGQEQHMRPGDLAILPPGRAYFYEFDGSGELVYFWTHFTGSAAPACIRRAGIGMDQLLPVGLDEALAATFQNLMDSFILMDGWQQEEAAGRLLVLLSALGRAAAGRHVRPATAPIRRSLTHMEANYGGPITLTELANMEFLSVSRYSALFRACTGIPPKEYLIRLRMRSAMELLTRTDMSVTQVARAVGYADPLYFSRLFKKRMGTPPSEVRRALR